MTDPSALYTQLTLAFKQGKWQESQALVQRLLPFSSEHAGVHGIAGVVCLELQQLSQAVDHLRRATEIDPSRADFATLYAKALLSSHLTGQARLAADRAMALRPEDPDTLATLGVVYVQTQAHSHAAAAFEQAATRVPESSAYRFNLATTLAATGQVSKAESELETAIALDPSCWHAHLLLAQVRQQTLEQNHLARLHALLASYPNETAAVISLNMALAKEYEDLGRYPEAFRHMSQGKTARRSSRPYSSSQDERLFAELMGAFPDISAVLSSHNTGDEAIFIIGMPRSGTTLIERILSSHPDVYAAGELQNFAAALQQQSHSSQSFLLDANMAQHTRAIDWAELGTRYLASTRPAPTDKPRFIDKLPHNFLYAGHIACALPKAKIICMRRNPMDTCLGNFRQLFAHPSIHFDYSNDLLDTGRYFVLFDRLMRHWQRVFPGRIHEVSYEALVRSPEALSRELADYCGLTWSDACLDFETNPAPVGTISSQQVRKPIFHTSVGRWNHYAQELSELRKLLRSEGLVEQ